MWYLLNDCQNQITLIFLHQVDFIDLVDFANNQVDILASGRLFLTRSILQTNVAQIESIIITIEPILSRIESVFFNRVEFADSRVERGANRVDSGDAHNTFLESTILKQMACHKKVLISRLLY